MREPCKYSLEYENTEYRAGFSGTLRGQCPGKITKRSEKGANQRIYQIAQLIIQATTTELMPIIIMTNSVEQRLVADLRLWPVIVLNELFGYWLFKRANNVQKYGKKLFSK